MAKILGLKCDSQVSLTREMALTFPSSFLSMGPAAPKRAAELGYGALIFGFQDSPVEKRGELRELDAVMEICRAHGLKIIFKPYLEPSAPVSPLDPNYAIPEAIDRLCRRFPEMETLFWESQLHHPAFESDPLAQEATQADLVVEELRRLEAALAGRASLLFYVPFDEKRAERQARWLPRLYEAAGPKTRLAISSVGGAPWHCYQRLHPFWGLSLEAFPILNLGLIGQGEGLWPILPFDLLEFPREDIIVLADHLPGRGGFLECSLWLGTQPQARSTSLLAESWLKRNRPDLNVCEWLRLGRRTRALALEVTGLKGTQLPHEVRRLQIESLVAQLKFEQSYWEAQRRRAADLTDYFAGFAYEAKRLLVEAAKLANVTLFGLSLSDEKSSFWKTPVGRKIVNENSFP
jgi:hypothetical protein